MQDVHDTTTMLIASTAKGSESYEVHTAWDKQGKAMAAIARAQAELRSMIKTYDELTQSPLATEEQRQRIELLKIKIESNQGSKSDTSLMESLLDAVKGGDEVED